MTAVPAPLVLFLAWIGGAGGKVPRFGHHNQVRGHIDEIRVIVDIPPPGPIDVLRLVGIASFENRPIDDIPLIDGARFPVAGVILIGADVPSDDPLAPDAIRGGVDQGLFYARSPYKSV